MTAPFHHGCCLVITPAPFHLVLTLIGRDVTPSFAIHRSGLRA
jgi:hypothetical protein